MTRLLVIFCGLAMVAWASLGAITGLDLFRSLNVFHEGVEIVAYCLTAVAVTLVLAFLLLDVAMPLAFSIRPSGLSRTITTITLTIVVSATLLASLGYDVGAILTTSAILGAVIGLALQPTLGSLFSGMALSSVRNLKPGSMLVVNGNWVKVEATDWRHVKGRSADGSEVFIPNGVLAQTIFSIFPEDRSTRFDVMIPLPADVPPQQVTDALVGAFVDIEQLDSSRPVKVGPFEPRPDLGATIYRIRLWTRDYDLIYDLQGEVLRRAWYVLDRIGVRQPRNYRYETSHWKEPTAQQLLSWIRPDIALDDLQAMAAAARVYRFAPMEILHFPATDVGRIVVTLQGKVCQGADPFLNTLEFGRSSVPYLPPIPAFRLSEAAELRQVADKLSHIVGPVAEQLMRAAAETTQNCDDLITQLGANIADEAQRTSFLAEARQVICQRSELDPGAVARLVKGPTGQVTALPNLRAMNEVLVATLPPEWMAVLASAAPVDGVQIAKG